MKNITYKKVMASVMGIFLVGMGVAFNNRAMLGNDPIGLVYDGIRNISGMHPMELGMTSNIVNVCLMVILFFLARHNRGFGQLMKILPSAIIYIVPYGTFVSFGTYLYTKIFTYSTLEIRAFSSAIGCLLLYLGVAICITVDIGVDPLTGITLFVRDITGKQYYIIKIIFDVTMLLLGIVLGGTYGVVTFLTAVAAGPLIHFFSKKLSKLSLFQPN